MEQTGQPGGLRQEVQGKERELRAALGDLLDRFGGGQVSLQVEMPASARFEEDPQWSGNLYKYSF
jgi:hypothetical protein